MIASGTNALPTRSCLSAARRKQQRRSSRRAEFIRALKRELPPAIAELQAANIAPADMPQSAIGPGMGMFSRYKAVLESDDSPMSVKTALQLINRELDEYLGGIQGEFDGDTRFAITWFEQHGMAKGDYGTADNIARARGISVESVKHAGIVESAAGKVRILARDELDDDWEPEGDGHLTVWECLQHLVRKLREGRHLARHRRPAEEDRREGRGREGSRLLPLRHQRQQAEGCEGGHGLQRIDCRLDRADAAGGGDPRHARRSPNPLGYLRGTERGQEHAPICFRGHGAAARSPHSVCRKAAGKLAQRALAGPGSGEAARACAPTTMVRSAGIRPHCSTRWIASGTTHSRPFSAAPSGHWSMSLAMFATSSRTMRPSPMTTPSARSIPCVV